MENDDSAMCKVSSASSGFEGNIITSLDGIGTKISHWYIWVRKTVILLKTSFLLKIQEQRDVMTLRLRLL